MASLEGFAAILPNGDHSGAERLAVYLGVGGYAAARRAVTEMAPPEVVASVERSALRGRGGAGFSVALKWQLVRDNEEKTRFVVANAYDADPLAPISAELLERNPHLVLEGLIIAAYAVGAKRAYVYCRGDRTAAVHRLRAAIAEAEEHELLGTRAFDGRLSLEVETAVGWGGFAGGEETAALEAIEGKRAMPRQKPPYPSDFGLWDRPTLVHCVETLANLPGILREGPGAWRPPGTKVLALAGQARRPGLVEAPLGTPLREVVYGRGGGVAEGSTLRAVQIGGPTGAVLPEALLGTPLDFDSLRTAGAFVGSGTLRLLDDSACMVDFAREWFAYLSEESCGKCVPCRLGTRRLATTLEGIVSGLGRDSDLGLMEELATLMGEASICGFGLTAPAVLRSTMTYFKDDYRVHIEDKRCPTGRCRPRRARRYERKTAI